MNKKSKVASLKRKQRYKQNKAKVPYVKRKQKVQVELKEGTRLPFAVVASVKTKQRYK